MLFRQEKSTFKKIQKIENFPKGVFHGFWSKMVNFHNGGFWPNPARKHRFLAKNGHFSLWWFLGKSSQKRSFFNILDRRECLLDEKKSTFKKVQKNGNFRKGLVHAFWQKMVIFLIRGFWANLVRKDRFRYSGLKKMF